MHLVSPLAAGIAGAGNGTVTFYERGTTTVANYYSDFEATQQLPGQSVLLDSLGVLVAYVAELVDVVVKNDLGVTVREFVAGAHDAAVEVISPSFTGVDYTSGASGTQKPTNLENVLDAWLTSAGAPNWQVLFNGTPTNLSSAFATTFFNVKNYGAVGNGVADDGAAILSAQAAATAVGGGTVFFPPGTYRITAAIPLAANTAWLGSGGRSTRLAVDSAAFANVLTLPGNGVGSISSVSQMWLTAINGASPGGPIAYTGASSGEFHFTDCIICDDLLNGNSLYAGAGGTATLKTVFTRCYMKMTASGAQLIISSGAARLTVRDCDLINANAVGFVMVDCPDNGVIDGNRFDWSSGIVGPGIQYIRIAPAVGSVVITGNTFVPNAVMACTAIFNTLAAPFRDCQESNNYFGNMAANPSGCVPYGYTTDGYAGIGTALHCNGHQTRQARTETLTTAAAAITVDPKALGTSVILRTGGVNLTVNANRGSYGDRWALEIVNTSGGAITVAGGTNIVFDPAFAPLAVNNNGYAQVPLQWLATTVGTGAWIQTAKAMLT